MVAILHDWVLFLLVLTAVSLGCGLLLERLAGRKLPGVLLLPAGFATVLTTADLVTAVPALARFTIGVVVALAVAGFAVGLPERRRLEGWAAGAALVVFLVYAAPIVLSGVSTFAGYVKLDDTATWLAMTDRVLTHGRTVNIPPSTYGETLRAYLHDSGYPVGSVLPLGIGAKLAGDDPAWAFQPYLAYQAAMLALCFQALLGGIIRSPRLRAVAVVVAAQPALLYGYAMWGSVKELVTVPLIALLVALSLDAARKETTPRGTLPLAVAGAALLAALNVGGGVWVALALAPALVLVRRVPLRAFVQRATFFVGALVVLSLPTLVTASSFFRVARHSLTGDDELGNLIRPLSVLQIAGIWPVGDFRVRPHDLAPTEVLIGVVCAAAVLGLALALSRRQGVLPSYVAASLVGAAILSSFGSPWVDGKVLATASPALLLAAMAGAAMLFERGNRLEAVVIAAAIVFGVGWSNLEQYRGVWLAPRDQLSELQTIGNRFAGQGPALLNEYSPFGGRHFLRQLDAESSGELRYHTLLLRNFGLVAKGGYADIDDFPLATVLSYPLLVLPRSPIESRPPSVYTLAWSGRYYDVWQLRPAPFRVLEHDSLGTTPEEVAVAPCGDVLRLAQEAQAVGGTLAYVPRRPFFTFDLSHLSVHHAGSLTFRIAVPPGTYQLWLDGTFAAKVSISVDGREAGSARHRVEHAGQFVPVGAATLGKGAHVVTVRYSGPDWRPGSAANLYAALSRLVLAQTTENVPFQVVAPTQARTLCGRPLDWIEATT